MSEYIGARITLISKSDIRYSGVLHEINSESSTVALENVKSFGTEGRRGNEDEIPPSDNVYEYIVFRGSDVKDLRIDEAPKETKPPPPQVPNDPAILNAARPSTSQHNQQNQSQRQQPPQDFGPGSGGQYPPQWGQYPPPYGGRGFGPQGGFPGGPAGVPGPPGFNGYNGYPQMPPYGPPHGWPGPPSQGFRGQGLFPPSPMPPNNQQGPPDQQPPQGPKGTQALAGASTEKDDKSNAAEVDAAPKQKDSQSTERSTTAPDPAAHKAQAPTPPVESKPDVAAALAAPKVNAGAATKTAPTALKKAPVGPKSARIIPAVPLTSPNPKAAAQIAVQAPKTTVPPTPAQGKPGNSQQFQNATQAATAAVAAAMAKLPKPGQPKAEADTAAIDNLARKVADMRADDKIRHSRQPGTGGFVTGRGRGRGRGGHQSQPVAKVEVPTTDFDFETSNAKFNKLDLVKEAIAGGSPMGENIPGKNLDEPDRGLNEPSNDSDVVIPSATTATYNKSTSFFDNISSEHRDREEAKDQRFGGSEFRSEERKKNLETFGQGSVDGYRGGYRGRGRGRGYRGRGAPRGRGRGFPQGGASAEAGTA
ncbi:hypothetical protein EJ05DRAFT_513504 [Pseudovirgaria hyperparasitica]|uniref:TFG box profile domain-containing protein n=1 Tax=Pseudovirgaria hyperparasitica TaxID=470096 RepID=A0A6A6VZU5_9PEZI|nr:uncharacterized protein EJ05DRAFT_513504 [Pseudovirgaria hyperparasitica]KAF2755200.1 hypothetical protein EJ05DRAFT_513504 [Pseudovirgaria hyperparasitica]